MKTIIKIFICISLIYTPFFAFAGAAEKWEILENVYDTSKNTVNLTAKKITQDAANSGVYKVHVPVNVSTLGSTVKMMLKGGVASAALYGLVSSVGWVIDEASKEIKKLKPVSPTDPTSQYYYMNGTDGIKYSSYSAAATGYLDFLKKQNPYYKDTTITGSKIDPFFGYPYLEYTLSTGNTFTVSRIDNPNYNPAASPQYQPVSDSELGNEIIGKGANKSPVPDIITDAYSPSNPVSDAPAPQQTLDALENANPEPETEPTGATKPKPNTDTDGDGEPDAYDPAQPEQGTEFQLPNFCSWAPAVCDFFTVQKADNKDIKNNQREQIEQDKTFFEKVAEWFDWSQADDELPENESPEIVEHVTPDLKEDAISWVASCPADESVPISLQGVSSTLVLSWSPWCQLLDVIKPAIIASAYIGAAFIVLGIRT